MRQIKINFPSRLVFGNGCVNDFIADFDSMALKNVLIVTTPAVRQYCEKIVRKLKRRGIGILVDESTQREPTILDLQHALLSAEQINADGVIGIGGGSVLDVAKLVAVLYKSSQTIHDIFGIDRVNRKTLYLACLPTTAGTGSEVSPNAILRDESDNQKKAVVSRYVVPDAAYVDPLLTLSVPPAITAATGIDALTHCIEAYANRYAHPLTDGYAIKGIRSIAKNLAHVFENDQDREAREQVALGSMCGGLCLGPVNTAAVHALAYPLGSIFHIAHGMANALLLPHVMRFNLQTSPQRYADIAIALGAEPGRDDVETAEKGVSIVDELNRFLQIPQKLSQMSIEKSDIKSMAEDAVRIERLLKNNLRHVSFDDAVSIYEQAF